MNIGDIIMSIYKVKPVETRADIEKQIEIEAANLMRFDFKRKDEAFKEAKAYIEKKYQDVVEKLQTTKK